MFTTEIVELKFVFCLVLGKVNRVVASDCSIGKYLKNGLFGLGILKKIVNASYCFDSET